jgi:phosphatidate phosphatase APP1
MVLFFPVEVSLSNYTDGNSIFVIAFVIDITIRKNNEIVQLEQKKELEQVSAKVKQLNAGLEKRLKTVQKCCVKLYQRLSSRKKN